MSLPRPLLRDAKAIRPWATGTPTFLRTVESVRSRCSLEIGSFIDRKVNTALAIPRLPSAFSKSIGLTLCGIAEEPTSFLLTFWRKYSIDIYVQMSRLKSMRMVLMRRRQSKMAARLS